MQAEPQTPKWRKDRSQFLSVLGSEIRTCSIDTDLRVLVVGGSEDDVDVLRRVGFKNITLSDLTATPPADVAATDGIRQMAIDVEAIGLANGSYDLVFAHEVLHHCRSAHYDVPQIVFEMCKRNCKRSVAA